MLSAQLLPWARVVPSPPCPMSCSNLCCCYFFLIHVSSQVDNYVEKHRACVFYVWIYGWEQTPAWQPCWLPSHMRVDQCSSLRTTSAVTWADLTWSERVTQLIPFQPFWRQLQQWRRLPSATSAVLSFRRFLGKGVETTKGLSASAGKNF